MPGGRPSKYSAKLTSKICSRLACGESLRSVCRDPEMPHLSTVFLWMGKYPEFSEQYARAKEESAEAIAEEMFEIADDGSNDWMEKHDPDNPGYVLRGEHVQRSKLRLDTRKWYLSKIKPKKYGDRQAIDHQSSDGSMSPDGLTHEQRKNRIQQLLAKKDASD